MIWGNWMDEGVIAKRHLFSMTFRDVTARPIYVIYEEGLSGQDETGCLQEWSMTDTSSLPLGKDGERGVQASVTG